jgi:hypothetical protein
MVTVNVELLKDIRKKYAGSLTSPTLLAAVRQYAAFEHGDLELSVLQTTCLVAYQQLDYINFLDKASTSLVANRVPRVDFY